MFSRRLTLLCCFAALVLPCSATVTGPALNQTLTVNYSNNVDAGTATASGGRRATSGSATRIAT